LLVILGIIVIGVAITIGVSIVNAQTVSTNRDAIINDLNHPASYAYQYRLRLRSMGGGQGDYTSFVTHNESH